jgi:hypothetical protein
MAQFLLAALTAVALTGPPGPQWVALDEARITYYGPRYTGGELTASGVRYMPDDDIAALGPDLLARVRAHYAAQSLKAGRWVATPRYSYVSVAGGYPLWPCLDCEPRWWGYLVRVCAGDRCETLRVADTGSPALEVDLPDETWLRFGYPAERGVFTGTVEVLAWGDYE